MKNFERMVRLADEFFAAKNDPDQLTVTPAIIERLRNIHPMTLTDRSNDDGPFVWILMFPTTRRLMTEFLSGRIGEGELFEQTIPGMRYDAVYLCSALVLPEFRGHGHAYRATIEAVDAIRRDHPVTSLFVWDFSDDGKRLAESVARYSFLPLLFRRDSH